MRTSIERSSGEPRLRIDPDLAGDLQHALESALGERRSPVIVTDPDLRPHIQRLAHMVSPTSVVLSFEDLLPHIEVEPIGRIRVGNE